MADTNFALKVATDSVVVKGFTDQSANLQKWTDVSNNVKASISKDGGVMVGADTAAASASNAGTMRYRVDGTISYFEVCMRTADSTYEWVVIKENDWTA